MGTAIDQFDMIAWLCTEGHLPFGARIGDIGCQQLWGGNVEGIRRFLKAFGHDDLNPSVVEEFAENGAFIGHCLRTVGFDYTSFDVVEAPFCRFLDLETDPTPDPGTFDLVLNFGTTEHVLNQFNTLRILHEMVKPGGLIYSSFIRGGNMEHGLLHYSDRFVDLWMRPNHYEQIWRYDHDVEGEETTWIIVRKSREGPFRRIIDVQEGEGLPQLVKPDQGTDGAISGSGILLLQFEQQLHAIEQEVDAKKLLVQQLEQQLRAAAQETDERKMLVQQLEQQLRAAAQETDERKVLVQQLEQQLRAAEQEADERKVLALQLEQQLRAAEQETDERKVLVLQLEQQRLAAEQENDAKKLLVLQLEQQLRGAEQKLDAMIRSNSWRITAPLRGAARFLRRQAFN